MTTIAFDGTYVACDSQITAGSTKSTGEKFWSFVDEDGRKCLAFGAGDMVDLQAAVESLSALEAPQEGDYELLVLSAGVPPQVHCGDGRRPLALFDGHWATGSGAHAALGAMKAGKTATEAALIACSIDLYSSPPIQTYNTVTRRWLKPRTR